MTRQGKGALIASSTGSSNMAVEGRGKLPNRRPRQLGGVEERRNANKAGAVEWGRCSGRGLGRCWVVVGVVVAVHSGQCEAYARWHLRRLAAFHSASRLGVVY